MRKVLVSEEVLRDVLRALADQVVLTRIATPELKASITAIGQALAEPEQGPKEKGADASYAPAPALQGSPLGEQREGHGRVPLADPIVAWRVQRSGEHEKEVADLRRSLEFWKRRCDALQKAQQQMRDPERTMVCDILANGFLLSPAGDRYTAPTPRKPEHQHDLLCVCGAEWDIYSDGREELVALPTPRKPLDISEVLDLLPPAVPANYDGELIALVRTVEARHGITGEQT